MINNGPRLINNGPRSGFLQLYLYIPLILVAINTHNIGTDCFKIGKVAYNDKDWKHTRDWMLAALEQFDHEQGKSNLDIGAVYDHLAFAEYSVSMLVLSLLCQ